MPPTLEKELEEKIIAVIERYYTYTEEDGLSIPRAASDAGIKRMDVVYYMIEHHLYPEVEDPIRCECLERLMELKERTYLS